MWIHISFTKIDTVALINRAAVHSMLPEHKLHYVVVILLY